VSPRPLIIDTTAETIAVSPPRPLPPAAVVKLGRVAGPDFAGLGRGLIFLLLAVLLAEQLRRSPR
jgi:hypothetical protein